jgi:prepilin-type N-terminal cleavage/methylation domain-containing protein
VVTRDRRFAGARTAHAGFSLVELIVAMAVSLLVIGGATMLAGQMQMSYRMQLEGATAQQEARAAVELIQRFLRGAGNNPYRQLIVPCPAANTPFLPIRMDPDGDGIQDDIRIQMDANPVDSLIGGTAGACTQAGEDITISHDAVNRTITFLDNNVGGGAVPRTDGIITNLRFIYRNSSRAPTAAANSISFIETQVTARTNLVQDGTSTPLEQTVVSEIRVRVR